MRNLNTTRRLFSIVVVASLGFSLVESCARPLPARKATGNHVGLTVATPNAAPEEGVVLIELPDGGGYGAGIVLAIGPASKNYEVRILTAYHVIQPYVEKLERQVPVYFYRDPTPFTAEINGDWTDPAKEEDLAVIRIQGQSVPKNVTALQLGSVEPNCIVIGSEVMSIGHRVDRRDGKWLRDDRNVIKKVERRITFSRSITGEGFSGGPLLDKNAAVVGMVYSVDRASDGPAYAKTVTRIREFLKGKEIDITDADTGVIQQVLNRYQEAMEKGDLTEVERVRPLTAAEEKIMNADLKITKGKGYVLNCSSPEFKEDGARVSCDMALTRGKGKPSSHVDIFLKLKCGQWYIDSSQ